MSPGLAQPAAAPPVEPLRRAHLGMLDAVLEGGGVVSVADLAAATLGGTVVVALPTLDVTVCAPDRGDRRAAAVRAHVEDRGAPTPLELTAEAPVRRGDEPLGAVVLLGARRRGGVEADEVLRLAALAVRTAVALEDRTAPAPSSAVGAFFSDLRRAPAPSGRRVLARAEELGCDLRYGGVALCAAPESGTTQRALAAIVQDAPRALAHVADGRVEALVPESGPEAGAPPAAELARRAARRLCQHGAVGISVSEPGPGDLPRALLEARLVLELREGGAADLDALQSGAWRLLTRLAVLSPAEVDRLVDTALGPLLDPGTRSGAALLATLTTYVDAGGSMRATATAGFAHRHTIAYRLERIGELTGHDPRRSDGLEQLSLGLKARAVRDALRRAAPTR